MKKLFYIHLLSLISTFYCFGMELEFKQEYLDKIAIQDGYGYKYGNLTLLQKLAQQFNKEQKQPYQIQIPKFVGIPSQAIQNFFNSSNFDIDQQWAEFVKQYLPKSKKKEILDSKKFPDNFEQVRAKLETQLRNLFDKKIAEILAQKTFSFDANFKIQGADELIKKLAQEKGKLMVRSTGREDTKELANAGGNISIANVIPNAKNILESIRDVVLSYFGQKSLTQRLGAEDESLFDITTPPLTPILLQIMIGESDPKKLPKCGVMFTEEAEGALSKLEAGKTSGITLIQCAYGHNEGVVNSLIPVDSFYIDETSAIYPIIRYKTQRLIPSSKPGVRLEMVPNEGTIVKKPALTKDAVLTLKKFAQALEKFYQGPMDVEFIIKEEEKTIYIAQARPIVHKTDKPSPSYLLNLDESYHKLQGYAIGVAGGTVRTVTSKDEIITAETLGDALRIYQNPEETKDPKKIQCIVISTPAPATSHEATSFRSEQKPVICVDISKISEIKTWLLYENPVNIIISPQQGIIAGNKQDLAIKQGWCNYPCPALLSLSKEFEPIEDLTEEAVKKLLIGKAELKPTEEFRFKDFKLYIKQIKEDDAENASKNLALLLYQLNKLILLKTKNLPLDQDDKQRIKTLLHYALKIAQQTKNELLIKPTNTSYIKRLFPIHFLETLLFQQPATDEIVDGNSATNLIFKVFAGWQKILEEVKDESGQIDPLVIQLLRANKYIKDPDLQEKWKNFVIILAKNNDAKLKNAFTQFIGQLYKLNLIKGWINDGSFDALVTEKKGDAKNIVLAAIKEYASQKQLLSELFKVKAQIDAFNIEPFADPKTFEKQWDSLKNELLPYFLDNKFIDSFNKANNFGKSATLGIMHHFIFLFENSIKEMVSGDEEAEKKVQKLKTMLGQYLEILQKWISLIPKDITLNVDWNKYFTEIDMCYKSMSTNSKDMLFLTTFRGYGDVLDKTTNFKRPQTLEDLHTLIHQNIVEIITDIGSRIHLDEKLKSDGYSLASINKFMTSNDETINASDRLMLTIMYVRYSKKSKEDFKKDIDTYLPVLNQELWAKPASFNAIYYTNKLDKIFKWLDEQ